MKKTKINLIPNIVNSSPDYYCTWQTQLYATNGGTPIEQRKIINEQSLFWQEKPYGWAYFYEKVRRDLFFVMDDSWDVPIEESEEYFGCLQLNEEKFPTFQSKKGNTHALKSLSDKVKSLGWKGLGGWVCAQEAQGFVANQTEEAYWIERLQQANESGFALWKVDWGEKCDNEKFRQRLTDLGRVYAKNLVIEQAKTENGIPRFDLFRTYDVPAIMSIPMTMEKLARCLKIGKTEFPYKGLLNCEDEAYIAAAGGFVMGIMRHPYVGAFPNGEADRSFPAIHRNIKSKTYEVIRAIRWHRIAPAFGVDAENTKISERELSDTWEFQDKNSEFEQWWYDMPPIKECTVNGVLTKSAPAVIARNTELPIVIPDGNGEIPFIVLARNPNGAYSIVTAGRTKGREYFIPKCHVTISCGNAETIGIFGEYKTLRIKTTRNLQRVLMQDLAGDKAVDITQNITIENGEILIAGEWIEKIGTSAQPKGDTSEAGVVLRLVE